MFGAIIGDIVGSPYEFHNIKTKDFPLFSAMSRFTDDTILTCAVADWLLSEKSTICILRKWGNIYKNRTYENGKITAFAAAQECQRAAFEKCGVEMPTTPEKPASTPSVVPRQ